VRKLLAFPIGERTVDAIADRLNGWLALEPRVRDRAREALPRRARELWSWDSVASGVLAASVGRLDELPAWPE
jgi:hypothetical protein